MNEDARRRLNLHLSVEGPLLEWVLYSNAAIAARTETAIAFGPGQPELPHVTLLMGHVPPDFDTEGLWPRAVNRVRQFPLPALSFTRPYLAPGGNYVMADLVPTVAMGLIQRELRDAFGCTAELPDGNRLEVSSKYDSTTHLTVAYIDGGHVEVYRLLTELPDPPDLVPRSVELSETGSHGTCIHPLFRATI